MIEACYVALIWSLFTSSSLLGRRKASLNIRSKLKAHSPTVKFPILNTIPLFYSTFSMRCLSDGILSCNQPVNISAELKVSEVVNTMATQNVTVASTWNYEVSEKKKYTP